MAYSQTIYTSVDAPTIRLQEDGETARILVHAGTGRTGSAEANVVIFVTDDVKRQVRGIVADWDHEDEEIERGLLARSWAKENDGLRSAAPGQSIWDDDPGDTLVIH